MGGSGGGSAGSSSASGLPTWISNAHKGLVKKAEAFAYGDRGAYTPYDGGRIQGFTPQERSAFGARQDMFNRGDPMGEFAQGQLGEGSWSAGQLGEDSRAQFGQGAMANYMSPFMQGVIDPQLREANASFDRKRNMNEAQSAARGGSVGSYRVGLEGALGDQMRAQTLSDITGKGLQSAYEHGLGAFQKDRDARMSGSRDMAQAYNALAQTSDRVGSGNLERLGALASNLEKSGQTQREMNQQGLDLAYNDFQSERDWPMRNMSFLASMMQGVPANNYATTTTRTAQPGLASQLASLGLGAAALQQSFGSANGGLISGYAGGGRVVGVSRPSGSLGDDIESYHKSYGERRGPGGPMGLTINDVHNAIKKDQARPPARVVKARKGYEHGGLVSPRGLGMIGRMRDGDGEEPRYFDPRYETPPEGATVGAPVEKYEREYAGGGRVVGVSRPAGSLGDDIESHYKSYGERRGPGGPNGLTIRDIDDIIKKDNARPKAPRVRSK